MIGNVCIRRRNLKSRYVFPSSDNRSRVQSVTLVTYIIDKIWLESLAYLAEIFERFKAKREVTYIIQLRDESARIVFEVAKLTS